VAKQQRPVVGIIGLGIMGGIMAETLLAQGFEVAGHDPISSCRQRLKRAGGRVCATNAEVAQTADVLITSLPSAKALHGVVNDLGQAVRKKAKQIVIETSTLPLPEKEAAAQALAAQGRVMLDCPISGTATRVGDRTWTIYVSGPKTACRQVAPIFQALTDMAPYIGEVGAGTKLKYAANHLVAIYNVAYAETVNLCRKMGLDPKVALEHMGHSPMLGTGVMRLRMPFMIERQYTPPTMKVEVWQKDMQIIGDLAKAMNCPLPLFNTCATVYTAAMAQGLNLHDTASTAEVLAMMSGQPMVKGKSQG
jgi:putative dehydrogenase